MTHPTLTQKVDRTQKRKVRMGSLVEEGRAFGQQQSDNMMMVAMVVMRGKRRGRDRMTGGEGHRERERVKTHVGSLCRPTVLATRGTG